MTGRLQRLKDWMAGANYRRDRIPEDIQDRLPLSAIDRVTFFKLDQFTTDLICCEVEAEGQTWFFHEEAEGWEGLVRYLETLPCFKADWYEAVAKVPFARSETPAFVRT